jgi:hypothetical protein
MSPARGIGAASRRRPQGIPRPNNRDSLARTDSACKEGLDPHVEAPAAFFSRNSSV